MAECAYDMSAKQDFPNWLLGQLERRGWNQSALAARAHVTRTTVSDYINGKRRNYDKTVLVNVAEAFGIPVEEVFVAAGVFQPKPGYNVLALEGLHILQQLEGEELEDAIRYLRLRRQVQEERSRGARRRRPRAATT